MRTVVFVTAVLLLTTNVPIRRLILSGILRRVDWYITLDCLTLKMKSLRHSETSVTTYRSTLRDVSKDVHPHQHRCETQWEVRIYFIS